MFRVTDDDDDNGGELERKRGRERKREVMKGRSRKGEERQRERETYLSEWFLASSGCLSCRISTMLGCRRNATILSL